MKLGIKGTNRFIKQYKKVLKLNYFNEKEFEFIIRKLMNKEMLPIKYNNHLLIPKSRGIWDCHIKSDIILLYEKSDDCIKLIAIGSHSDLFK